MLTTFGQTPTPQFTIDFPSTVCAGSSTSLNTQNQITVNNPSFGCFYRGSNMIPNGNCYNGCLFDQIFNFTWFSDTDIVRTADDINYVILNMEHSFIGELLIRLTCPNQQSATILRYNHSQLSNFCNNNIILSNFGWQSGSNCNAANCLGYPNPNADPGHPCESYGNSANAPGIGFDYCWSNSSSYTYAGDDGLLYRASNLIPSTPNSTIQGSDREGGTHFYHPDQSFDTLIGCPMNGQWHLQVYDGYGDGHNGYIFTSGLSLRPSDELLSTYFIVDSIGIAGPWLNYLGNGDYTLNAPATLSHDTLVGYTVTFYDTTGATYDTLIPIQIKTADTLHVYYELCENHTNVFYRGNWFHFTENDTLFSVPTIHPDDCDTLTYLHGTIQPTVYSTLTDTICLGETYLSHGFNITPSHIGDYLDTLITTSLTTHCDSVVLLTLTVMNNPIFDITEQYGGCNSPTTQLSINLSGASYLWSNGATTQSVTVPAPGTYSVTVTNTYGCSAYDTIRTHTPPNPFAFFNLTDLCAGNSYNFTIDYDTTVAFVLESRTTAITVKDTVFLPDGISCDPYGCSYNSPVTFADFSPSAMIRNADDILFARIKLEHSHIGDLFIQLTCPNGQSAKILNFHGGSYYDYSECASLIPAPWGWTVNQYVNTYARFGVPIYDSSNGCEPTAMGTPWNYCWSNNTNLNYQYAIENGLVYEEYNSFFINVDSTDVANMTQVYHPEESFNSLIGCPLNGTWYLEIIDGWRYDNGYVTEWELSLQPELLNTSIILDTFSVEGPWVAGVSYNTFSITPPANLANDTTITYHLILLDANGCHYDTTFTVTIFATRYTDLNDTILLGNSYQNFGFNVSPDTLGTFLFTQTLTSVITHCDSIVTLTLTVIELINDTTYLDTTLCSYNLPVELLGQIVYSDSTITQIYHRPNQSDSVVICSVHVIHNPISAITTPTALCAGDSMTLTSGYAFDPSGDWNFTLLPQASETFSVHILTGPWASNNSATHTIAPPISLTQDTLCAYTFTATELSGCAFDTTFNIAIHATSSTQLNDTICANALPYVWGAFTFTEGTTQTLTLQNSNGCDSIVQYTLTVVPMPTLTVSNNIAIHQGESTTLTATGAETFAWSPDEDLSSSVGGSVTATPTESTYFTVTASNSIGATTCVATDSIQVLVYVPLDTTLCENELPLTWHGELFTQSETRDIIIPNSEGLDEALTLQVIVHENTSSTLNLNIRDDELPFDTAGLHFTGCGSQQITLVNANGCDSILTVNLTVHYPSTSTTDTAICVNALPLQWNNRDITMAGSYVDSLQSVFGTDSIVVLNLTIFDIDTTRITDTICIGTNYNQNGFNVTPTTSGQYFATLRSNSTISGCDSITILALTITEPTEFTITETHGDCSSDTTHLSVSIPGGTYHWSNGATTQSVSVPTPGLYSVTVTDAYGCQAVDTLRTTTRPSPFSTFNIPDLCAGASYNLNIDFDATASVALQTFTSSLAVNDTIFLPDGISCDPYGCSYRSPVTFTDFAPGATLMTANDLFYLRLNIEHSFIGDLYINITCPNGQKADILKKYSSGSSTCMSQIPSSSRGWNTSASNNAAAYFGLARDVEANNKCNSTLLNNRPGIGWNYCWSNNMNQGYTYANSNGSLVYRSANAHIRTWAFDSGPVIDSSNVAAHTQFYHPDQNFSSLIGCPLNGSWYIEVMDGFSVDNGYIFGWELALAPDLLPDNNFVMDTFYVNGPWVSVVDSNIFNITPPADLANDTTIAYIITLVDTNGCTFDSTFNVHFWATRHTEIQDSICQGVAYNNYGFNVTTDSTGTFTYSRTTTSVETQCDSIVTLTLNVLAPTVGYDTIVAYDSYTWHGTTFTASDSTASFLTISSNGCDSLVYLQLTILYSNDTIRTDTTVCGNNLPLNLFGTLVYRDSIVTRIIPRANGSDSVIITTVHVITNPISAITTPISLCAGDTLPITAGHADDSNILLLQPTHSHTDTRRIFIPDGMSCEPYGTYYRSYANFSQFIDSSVISTADDILYLRLKIEHSAIEDIRISLVCPNGQSCRIVPDYQHDTWGSDATIFHRLNLGLANRLNEVESCDSTLNTIGIPWNYVWSNNTSQGYQYANSPNGYVYEAANVHFQSNPYWDAGSVSYVIDSSNVSAMSQIYHPSQSFDSLIGCPLNGNWYIQVEDLWENDNGYLVEWELSLTPTLTRQIVSNLTNRTMTGPWVHTTSDSTFVITPPITLTHDTLATYAFSVTDSIGCTFDTTFSVMIHPLSTTQLYDTICANALPYTWNNLTFAQAGTQTLVLPNINGCDSTIYHNLTVVPMPTLTVSNDVAIHAGASTTLTASGAQQYSWSPSAGLSTTTGGNISASPTTSTFYAVTASNVNGTTSCSATDSIQVLVYVPLDTTLCENDLPFTWYGETFADTATRDIIIVNPNGLDNALTLRVHVNHNTTATVNLSIVENQLPFDTLGLTFTAPGTQQLTIANANGCDSTITVNVQVNFNTETLIDSVICQDATPLHWIEGDLNATGTYTSILTNANGADSVVTLNLTVNPTYQVDDYLEICKYDLPYYYEPANHTFPIGAEENSILTYTLPTVEGCDSTINLNVTVHNTHIEIISNDEEFCTTLTATLEVVTDMQNYVWNTGETSPIITVEAAGTYSVTGTSGPCTAETKYAIAGCELTLEMPNAITPNGDGMNDYFAIDERYLGQLGNAEFEIVILNRWGEVVFTSRDKHFKWYGDVRGTTYHNALYNYMIRYTNMYDRPLIYKGSLLVM